MGEPLGGLTCLFESDGRLESEDSSGDNEEGLVGLDGEVDEV